MSRFHTASADTAASASDAAASGSGARRKARAPLSIRILLGVCAAILMAVATLAGVNLLAGTQYDQATQSLVSNLNLAAKDDADLDTLAARQQQTDARFADASTLAVVCLPQLKHAISTNAAISHTLTTRIEQARKGNAHTATAQELAAQALKQGGQGGGLTAEQRRQVEDLLKANRQSSPSTDSTTGQGTDQSNPGSKGKESTSQPAKPW